MMQDLVELRVHGVKIPGPDSTPVLGLRDASGDRELPLPIGPAEASAVIIELEGIVPPRPLTHDLLADFFHDHGFILERVEFYGIYKALDEQEDGYLAKLVYHKGVSRFEKDVRPSDAVALALRLKAPICAKRDLFDRQAIKVETVQRPRARILRLKPA